MPIKNNDGSKYPRPLNPRPAQVTRVPIRSSYPPVHVSNGPESRSRNSVPTERSETASLGPNSAKMIVQALSHSRVRHESERLMKKYENQTKALDREGFRKVLRELDPDGREALPAQFE